MIPRSLILAAMASAALAGTAWSADKPATPAKPAAANPACFFSRDWAGWRAPDDKTIYLRVRIKDVYKLDLAYGSSLLTWPDTHLVNVEHGSDYICDPLDFQLKVAESNSSVSEPLIVKAMTKLTPEQVEAIPKKFRP